jgi:hypothetical protein
MERNSYIVSKTKRTQCLMILEPERPGAVLWKEERKMGTIGT